MIKKIILLILIVVTLYGISIFVLPEVSSKIDTLIAMPGLSDSIRWTKKRVEKSITDIPSLNEFKSWALDAKEKFVNGVDITKDKIDTLRQWAQKAEKTFEDAKNTFNQVKQTVNNAKEVIDDMSSKVEQIWEVVNTIQDTK